MKKKYAIAEVATNKIDGAKVCYLSDRPGYRTTDDIKSAFLKVFDSIEEAQKNIEYANQCVVAVWV